MNALKGAFFAVASSLLIAVLFAYLFRLPIPMGGYIGPFSEVSTYGLSVVEVLKLVLIAWKIYGLMFGGLIILSLCGAITGVLTGRKYSESKNKDRVILLYSAIVSTIVIFILSILDYVIGPW